MAISYRPYEPRQEMLLPASLHDWLPTVRLAYFISDTEQRQRDAVIERGCYKREFGVSETKAQDNFTDRSAHHEAHRWQLRFELQRPDGRGCTPRTSSWPRRWATTPPT